MSDVTGRWILKRDPGVCRTYPYWKGFVFSDKQRDALVYHSLKAARKARDSDNLKGDRCKICRLVKRSRVPKRVVNMSAEEWNKRLEQYYGPLTLTGLKEWKPTHSPVEAVVQDFYNQADHYVRFPKGAGLKVGDRVMVTRI